MIILTLFGCLLALLTSVYLYLRHKWSYWEKLGVPSPSFTSIFARFFTPTHLADNNIYKNLGRIAGSYDGTRPVLYLGEPELIQDILVKDFHIFPNHRTFQVNHDVVLLNLFNLKGSEESWKRVRAIVSPTFSSGKMRAMTPQIDYCIDTLATNLEKAASSGKPMDMKLYFGAFTMDVITSTAFGVKLDSMNDPDNPLVSNARKIFNRSVPISAIIAILFPRIGKLFKFSVFNSEVTKVFEGITRKIAVEQQKNAASKEKTKAVNFMQLMLAAMDEGDAKEGKEEFDEEDKQILALEKEATSFAGSTKKRHMSMDELTAQGIVFFLAGYDSTASTLSYAAYLLASNLEAQKKIQEEVDNFPETEIAYDNVGQLKYVDAVIWETLRLFPAAVRVERESVAEYSLGTTGITLPPNSLVVMPLYAMQRDPKNFVDPDDFKPERFLSANHNHGFASSTAYGSAASHPYAFIPFGGGPRNCLAMRLALLETKMCLAKCCQKFEFHLTPETKLEWYNGQILISPKQVMLQVKKRNVE